MDRGRRVRRVFCISGMLLAVLSGYYLLVSLTPVVIPCAFHKITGLLCPGCGVTRMLLAISHGNFVEAFGYNPALFILLPVLAADLFWCIYLYIRYGRVKSRIHSVIMCMAIVILTVFGVWRNL